MSPDPHASPAPTPTGPRAGPPPASLRRELLAIAVLYFVISILPLLLGLALAP